MIIDGRLLSKQAIRARGRVIRGATIGLRRVYGAPRLQKIPRLRLVETRAQPRPLSVVCAAANALCGATGRKSKKRRRRQHRRRCRVVISGGCASAAGEWIDVHSG